MRDRAVGGADIVEVVEGAGGGDVEVDKVLRAEIGDDVEGSGRGRAGGGGGVRLILENYRVGDAVGSDVDGVAAAVAGDLVLSGGGGQRAADGIVEIRERAAVAEREVDRQRGDAAAGVGGIGKIDAALSLERRRAGGGDVAGNAGEFGADQGQRDAGRGKGEVVDACNNVLREVVGPGGAETQFIGGAGVGAVKSAGLNRAEVRPRR